VFVAFGLRLAILPSGCCGMAGTWGHETEHRATSERIYGLSWGHHVAGAGTAGTLLADGYSCRSQAKLVDGVKLPHPVQVLLAAIRRPTATGALPEAAPRNAEAAGLHQTPVDAEAAQMG
jgi:Fe-S oxidoreductase